MEFKWHILVGFVASYILIQFFDFSLLTGLIIFLSSWLIDVDHYFWYSVEMKDWNPFHAIKWYQKSIPKWFSLAPKERARFKRGVFVFHGIIFLALLFALSFSNKIFLWILVGVGIHMVMDWIDEIGKGEPFYGKTFPCYVIRRNKNKKALKEL
ncbi:hypothetical protein HN935_01395 [archaeon]|jgi:hypothetical protein|nr:hypothetical protein [archaeon]